MQYDNVGVTVTSVTVRVTNIQGPKLLSINSARNFFSCVQA